MARKFDIFRRFVKKSAKRRRKTKKAGKRRARKAGRRRRSRKQVSKKAFNPFLV